MRNVMLIAAILSVIPGFVCGMENEREEEVSLFEGSCVQQVMKEDLKPQPPSVMRMIKEDMQARKNKISRGLVEVGCPKCCADACGACESIGCCGCLKESGDRYIQDVDIRDLCPTFLFLSTTAAVIAGMAVGAPESNMRDCFYAWDLFIHLRFVLTLGKRTVDLWCMRKKKSE